MIDLTIEKKMKEVSLFLKRPTGQKKSISLSITQNLSSAPAAAFTAV